MASIFGKRANNHRRRIHTSQMRGLSFEQLEDRSVLSAFSVVNLNDSGVGSLRQAIIDANNAAGADTIEFEIVGTIDLTSGALPLISDQVDIDGSTAPGYTDAPLVEIDFNQFDGLDFTSAAVGSALQALALTNSGGDGVYLDGSDSVQLVGNYIGLSLDGTTAAGNQGSGVVIYGASGVTIQSNVISGNLADGIGLYGADDNQIAMNYVGTDAGGTSDLGNGGNGILIASASSGNMIGGEATGGNDPTNGVFVTPPMGNLISGNNANGVLINGGATNNQLSGNFIGTSASGNSDLGNTLDGVAIQDADGNSLIGCTFEDNPFVFYNVISGNGANGLRVTDADDTTIQANFFGMGADNATAVGNTQNGVVVEGSSAHTTMGGPIPLGNVDAANGLNGIVVQDTASYFTSYNTFCGLAAFSDDPSFGNAQDGMLITSTGGNILIRTNVVTSNGDNGIEVSGNARDVRVVGNIVGLNTDGMLAMGNTNNGVQVGGNATDIVVGGPQPTFNVIPQNTISGNSGYGIAIVGTAHNITVNNSYVGTAVSGETAIGNGAGGVLLGSGTYSNSIGSTDSTLRTVISGNLGDGVELQGTQDNEIIGTRIGTNAGGTLSLGNSGDGISMASSYSNLVGVQPELVSQRLFISSYDSESAASTGGANQIAFNGADGVSVASGSSNTISANSIRGNTALGINLASGANMNMPAPVLTSVEWTASGVHVLGTLQASASSQFIIQFFANEEDEPSGDTFLGSQPVFTDSAGAASFDFTSSLVPQTAHFITATAIDTPGNTSEFSAALS